MQREFLRNFFFKTFGTNSLRMKTVYHCNWMPRSPFYFLEILDHDIAGDKIFEQLKGLN